MSSAHADFAATAIAGLDDVLGGGLARDRCFLLEGNLLAKPYQLDALAHAAKDQLSRPRTPE